ncbi:MAG: mechanosensitive ion channel family protein [Pyrinomonadaceae bacterium]
MQFIREFLEPVLNGLNYNIFALGDAKITPLSIIYLLLLTALLVYVSGKLRSVLVERVLGRTHLDAGARQAIGTISRYVLLFLGVLIILQTVGINLTTLNVVAGAVGIGVGFGLQNIASNFISGLIILTERPVKVGDRIEVGNVDGKVMSIGARSTAVRTNDNITIIVPNSKFISENVVNWSFKESIIRFRVPVGVAYDADLHLVKKLLLEAAAENKDVLTDPKSAVRLMKFGDSSIDLQLWVWTKDKLQRNGVLISDLNFAIWDKFCANNIEIPFPQTDLHIKSGKLELKKDGSKSRNAFTNGDNSNNSDDGTELTNYEKEELNKDEI